MKKMMHYGKLLALAGLVGIVSAEAGGSAYFYRRTMMRYNAKTERTMKMSGVDWDQYGFLRKVPGIPGMSFIDGITYLLPENEWTGGCIDQ